jgi:hypothetical protein
MILLQLFRSCAHRPSMMQPLLSICTLLSARCRETTPLLTGETALPGWAEIDSARAWSIASSASSVIVFPAIFSYFLNAATPVRTIPQRRRRRVPWSSAARPRVCSHASRSSQTVECYRAAAIRWARIAAPDRVKPAHPKLHLSRLAARSRKVSGPQMPRNPMRIRPTFQWFFESDICRFESSHPSYCRQCGLPNLCRGSCRSHLILRSEVRIISAHQ